jgi:hypothetical protein
MEGLIWRTAPRRAVIMGASVSERVGFTLAAAQRSREHTLKPFGEKDGLSVPSPAAGRPTRLALRGNPSHTLPHLAYQDQLDRRGCAGNMSTPAVY